MSHNSLKCWRLNADEHVCVCVYTRLHTHTKEPEHTLLRASLDFPKLFSSLAWTSDKLWQYSPRDEIRSDFLSSSLCSCLITKTLFFPFFFLFPFGTSFYFWISEPTPQSSQHLPNIPKSLFCSAPIFLSFLHFSNFTFSMSHFFLFLPLFSPSLLLFAFWWWILSLPLLTFLVNNLKIYCVLWISKSLPFFLQRGEL